MKQRFESSGPVKGRYRPPADKSISHRAAILAAACQEPVAIRNYLDAADTNSTLGAIEALGSIVERRADEVLVRGTGLREAAEPDRPIDVGNAGTLLRLLPGWLAGQEGKKFVLDGDSSIRKRPVDRISEPLRLMGADLAARDDRLPPLRIVGSHLVGIEYELPVASAQVKSCVLFAGLPADGTTTVIEPVPSRDHTERMLLRAGVAIEVDGNRVSVQNVDELELETIVVPGDLSSAAFMIAAAVLVPHSRLLVEGVSTNHTRTGFLRIAQRMGAVVIGELEADDAPLVADEPTSEIDVASGPLIGTTVEADEVPLAIDELPLVALLGCFAEGETRVRGAAELRVKESDRIETVTTGLRGLGADIEATGLVAARQRGVPEAALRKHPLQ